MHKNIATHKEGTGYIKLSGTIGSTWLLNADSSQMIWTMPQAGVSALSRLESANATAVMLKRIIQGVLRVFPRLGRPTCLPPAPNRWSEHSQKGKAAAGPVLATLEYCELRACGGG